MARNAWRSASTRAPSTGERSDINRNPLLPSEFPGDMASRVLNPALGIILTPVSAQCSRKILVLCEPLSASVLCVVCEANANQSGTLYGDSRELGLHGGGGMANLLSYRAQEALCRIHAVTDEQHRDLWLSMAERWEYFRPSSIVQRNRIYPIFAAISPAIFV